MDEVNKDKKPEAPSSFEELAKRKMERFVPGTLAERYTTGSGGLRYAAALHGSNRRPTRTKQPEEESGARLIKDMLSQKQATLMSGWDHDYFYEMVQQLVADERMKDYQPDSLFFAHRTGVAKALTDELGLTPVRKNLDNNPVFRRADLEAKLREDPKTLSRLAEVLDVDISAKPSIKTAVTGAPSASSQDEMIEKIMKSSRLYNERMLSLTQDMMDFSDAIGANYERRPGGHYVVAENSFIAKMIETPWEGKNQEALAKLDLFKHLTLTPLEVLHGLKDRDLVYGAVYRGDAADELRVRGKAAVEALASVGLKTTELPSGGYAIQLQSFKDIVKDMDMKALESWFDVLKYSALPQRQPHPDTLLTPPGPKPIMER